MPTYSRAIPDSAPVLLDTAQVACILGWRPSTLEARRSRGTGPPYVRLGPTSVRYKLTDLEAWLEARVANESDDLAPIVSGRRESEDAP